MITDLRHLVLIRGGGDLASGVALRLHRVGFQVLVTELPEPLAVRRLVSFADAVYQGRCEVEGVIGRRVDSIEEIEPTLRHKQIPVIIDPDLAGTSTLNPLVLIDGRMIKRPPEALFDLTPFVIGLGPGFIAGQNCNAVIETNRGHSLGRVIWRGSALPDTGIPDKIGIQRENRVLRAPEDGIFQPLMNIGDRVSERDIIGEVAGRELRAPFKGVLRGLLFPGLQVRKGMKIGDIDPRDDQAYCSLVPDKSLAIAGGVLEAILSRSELRKLLCT